MAKAPEFGLYITGKQGKVLMRKIGDLQQQNADLVAALKVASDRLHLFRALQGDTLSHWDVDDDNALDKVAAALAKAGE